MRWRREGPATVPTRPARGSCAQMEQVNGEPRSKAQVMGFKKVDFARESRSLLDAIKAYGV